MTLGADPQHAAAERTAITSQIKTFGKTIEIAQNKAMAPDASAFTPGASFRSRPRIFLAECKNLLDFGCNEEYQLGSAVRGHVPHFSRRWFCKTAAFSFV